MHKKFIFTERQFFAKGETVCGEQQVASAKEVFCGMVIFTAN